MRRTDEGYTRPATAPSSRFAGKDEQLAMGSTLGSTTRTYAPSYTSTSNGAIWTPSLEGKESSGVDTAIGNAQFPIDDTSRPPRLSVAQFMGFEYGFVVWLDPRLVHLAMLTTSTLSNPDYVNRHAPKTPIPVSLMTHVGSLRSDVFLSTLATQTADVLKAFMTTSHVESLFRTLAPYLVFFEPQSSTYPPRAGQRMLTLGEYLRSGAGDAYMCISPVNKEAYRKWPDFIPSFAQLMGEEDAQSQIRSSEGTMRGIARSRRDSGQVSDIPESMPVSTLESRRQSEDVDINIGDSAVTSTGEFRVGETLEDHVMLIRELVNAGRLPAEVALFSMELLKTNAAEINMIIRALETDHDVDSFVDSLKVLYELTEGKGEVEVNEVPEASSSKPTGLDINADNDEWPVPVQADHDAEGNGEGNSGESDEATYEELLAKRAELEQVAAQYQQILRMLGSTLELMDNYQGEEPEPTDNAREDVNQVVERVQGGHQQATEDNEQEPEQEEVQQQTQLQEQEQQEQAQEQEQEQAQQQDEDAYGIEEDAEEIRKLEEQLLEVQNDYARLQELLKQHMELAEASQHDLEQVEQYERAIEDQREEAADSQGSTKPERESSQEQEQPSDEGDAGNESSEQEISTVALKNFGQAVIEQLYVKNVITQSSAAMLLARLQRDDAELLLAFVRYVENDQISDLVNSIRDILERDYAALGQQGDEQEQENAAESSNQETQNDEQTAGEQQQAKTDPEGETELTIPAIVQYLKDADRLTNEDIELIYEEYSRAFEREKKQGKVAADEEQLSLEDFFMLRHDALTTRTRLLTEHAEMLRRDLESTTRQFEEARAKAALEGEAPEGGEDNEDDEEVADEDNEAEPSARIKEPWLRELLSSVNFDELTPEQRQQLLQTVLMRAMLSGDMNFGEEDEDDDAYYADDVADAAAQGGEEAVAKDPAVGPMVQVVESDEYQVEYDSLPEPEEVVRLASTTKTESDIGAQTPRKEAVAPEAGAATTTQTSPMRSPNRSSNPQSPARNATETPGQPTANGDGGGRSPRYGRRADPASNPGTPAKSLNLKADASVVASEQQERHASADVESPSHDIINEDAVTSPDLAGNVNVAEIEKELPPEVGDMFPANDCDKEVASAADVVLVDVLSSNLQAPGEEHYANRHETLSTGSGMHVTYPDRYEALTNAMNSSLPQFNSTPRVHLPSAVDPDEESRREDALHEDLELSQEQFSVLVDAGEVQIEVPHSPAPRKTQEKPRFPQTPDSAIRTTSRSSQLLLPPDHVEALERAFAGLKVRGSLPQAYAELEPRGMVDFFLRSFRVSASPRERRSRLPSLTPPINPSEELLHSALEVYEADHDMDALQDSILLVLESQ